MPASVRAARGPRIALIGTVGVPARYGGFETLAGNLAAYRDEHDLDCELEIYCSANAYSDHPETYRCARLRYVPLDANGPASILYDAVSMLLAVWRRADVILILGVSGALMLPLIRLLSKARLVVNVDGIEWKRPKWNRLAATVLRWSESVAARLADVVIADNPGIVEHIARRYRRSSALIAYGGDHAVAGAIEQPRQVIPTLPPRFAVMLCRIEPENNVELILQSFAAGAALPLVAVGNWSASAYGRELRERYGAAAGVVLVDPVFDPGTLFRLREAATLYVHGHSAGGTNPALVEMMALGKPVLAFDCDYNRHTTHGDAAYFGSGDQLRAAVSAIDDAELAACGARMGALAREFYTWERIGRQYFDLLLGEGAPSE